MTKKPPISEQERSPKATHPPEAVKKRVPDRQPPPENLKEQGAPGNLRQNTRNQGYQQDRGRG